MGKTKKNSASNARGAPVSKPSMTGKRGTDDVLEKIANAKKQKIKVQTQTEKKQEESIKSEEEKLSDTELDQQEADGSPVEEIVAADDSAVLKNGSVEALKDGEPNKSGNDSDDKDEDESGGENVNKEDDGEGRDTEMKDPTPKKTCETIETISTHTQATAGSKTLFVGNIPFSAQQNDVMEFFKNAGEVLEVHFAIREGKFKGYGHVEFATVEGAKSALKLNQTSLNGRPLRVERATETGANTPNTAGANTPKTAGDNTPKTAGDNTPNTAKEVSVSLTIFVRGFDSSLDVDKIRSSLFEHFSACGDLSETDIRIPLDPDTQHSLGIAFVKFMDLESFKNALRFDGTELGNEILKVERAKSRGDRPEGGLGGRDGGRGRGRGGRGRGSRHRN